VLSSIGSSGPTDYRAAPGRVNQPDVSAMRSHEAGAWRESGCVPGTFVAQRNRKQGDASVLGMKYWLIRGDGRSANPMPFPRTPYGDIISVMSRRLGRAK
jgi:hypothetical protein